jgi:predicted metal-dependent peptidase
MSEQTPLSREAFDETMANMVAVGQYSKSYVFYGHMVAQCSIVLKRMKAPAGVSFIHDHYQLSINPELFDAYSLEERLFIIQHEMHHILNGHLKRLEDRKFVRFNYATDCAINQLGNSKHMPQGCIIPANLPSKHPVPASLSAEQYYELIDEDDLPPEDPSYGAGGGHDEWLNSQGDEELQDDITKSMIENAINSTSKSHGDIPHNISQYLDLFTRKRELDWKKVLRGITGNKKVNSRKTIMRRDRRNPNFEHIKGKTKDRMFDLLVISDVSGSVSDTALYSLWGEIRHICDVTKTPVTIVQVDTHPYEPEQLKKTTKCITRKAAGGTNLSPAIQKARDKGIKFNAVVVTTDGYLSSTDVAHFEAIGLPVIWLIEKNGCMMEEMSHGRMSAFQLKE